jgi:isoleucyl-tRNA synthetase
VPIPALHNTRTGHTVLDRESLDHILPILAEKGVEYWWTGPVEEFLPPALQSSEESKNRQECEWKKGTDTMDVWFDSGTSWSMLTSVSATEPGRKHLADLCLEGSDQHRGWFQSQLLTAMGVADRTGLESPSSPYGALITHGMVLDESGRKMSKSIGNILSPMTVIEGDKVREKGCSRR